MKHLSKSAARRKAYDDSQIARAVAFSAHIHLGPGESHKRECATAKEAFEAARELNKLSHYGRQATTYAITPEGFTFPMEPPAPADHA